MDFRATLLRGRADFQRVQFLAGLEAHGFAGSDADLGSGAGVAADASLAGADAEDAKAAQFNALTSRKSLFEALENCIHGRLRFDAGQARTLNHMMDDVLLNQWGILTGSTELTLLRPTALMLLHLAQMWKCMGNSAPENGSSTWEGLQVNAPNAGLFLCRKIYFV